MPLTAEDDQVVAACYRSLRDQPIGPADPLYVEIWEHADYDPVRRLCKHISWSEIKAELKSSPTFRQRVRKAIQSRLPEVQRQVQAFVEEVVNTVQQKKPAQRVVFLFDSFEKLRGTPSNEQEIMTSIERLFGSYLDMLQLPYVHCLYSVPAFVQFFLTNVELVIIPTVKLWEKTRAGRFFAGPA